MQWYSLETDRREATAFKDTAEQESEAVLQGKAGTEEIIGSGEHCCLQKRQAAAVLFPPCIQ